MEAISPIAAHDEFAPGTHEIVEATRNVEAFGRSSSSSRTAGILAMLRRPTASRVPFRISWVHRVAGESRWCFSEAQARGDIGD
jgi:hypothetical protein